MRMFTDEAIKTTRKTASELYKKVASYAPDEKFTRKDIEDLLFIIGDYRDELDSMRRARKRNR